MIELILIMETRSSNQSDYMYIKSTIDYYYQPRTFGITKIFATSKSQLTKQDNKIKNACKKTSRTPVIVVIADYDYDEKLNEEIKIYCKNNSINLIWMNSDIEDVYLGEKTKRKEKEKSAIAFQISKDKLLPNLKNLSEIDPLKKNKCSNILIILDKYLKRNKN